MTEERREKPVLEKRFYKISEMAALAGVAPSVLRFWENEFPQIRPKRTLSGQRVYRAEDAALIMRIRELLYERRFTIPGARNLLKEEAKKAVSVSPSVNLQPNAASADSLISANKATEAVNGECRTEPAGPCRSEIVAALSDIRRMLL